MLRAWDSQNRGTVFTLLAQLLALVINIPQQQMDDIIVYGANQAEHDERLEAVLTRLQQAKVTLNGEKCEFSKDTVKFLGQLVGKDGICPDHSKVSAVRHMTEPTDIHELRPFLGMVNQSGKYIPRLAELTHPLRELLSKKNAWVWGPPQQHAFNVIKEKLSSAPALAIFDPALETTLSADASSYGLGAVMTETEGWKLETSGLHISRAYCHRKAIRPDRKRGPRHYVGL